VNLLLELEFIDRWPLASNSSQNSLTSRVVGASTQNLTQAVVAVKVTREDY